MNTKLQKYIKDVSTQTSRQEVASRYGIIQDYNPMTNTASVTLPDQDSDAIGELLRDVPCPVYPGFEMVHPEPGRPCWVVFRRGTSTRGAVITHYFHHNYVLQDGPKKSNIRTGVPRYMNRM